MQLIDTHAHLYLPEFDSDRSSMIVRAQHAGVRSIIMPNIDRQSIQGMLELSIKHPGYCLPSMGLHPCSVQPDFEMVLDEMKQHLLNAQEKWWAIGETGLDYYWDRTFIHQQKQSFDRQLQWAIEFDLPIIIHSRDSLDDCIDMVASRQNGKLRGVFHCFSGTRTQVTRIKELGFYIGIGGVVTFKNGGLDKVLEPEDLSHLILETDAPYLAPVPHRGKRNEPAYTALILERLSSIFNHSAESIALQTTKNAIELFRLSA
jgi:TatD DNase family protein